MPLPLAIENLLHNARQEILESQIISGIIGVLLGPGCLVLSFLPVDATPENRNTLRIGGIIVCALLVGLISETRRKLAHTNRLIAVLRDDPDQVVSIFPYRQKSGLMGSYKIHVELKDGSTQSLPVAEADYKTLVGYFRTKFPYALREAKEERIQ